MLLDKYHRVESSESCRYSSFGSSSPLGSQNESRLIVHKNIILVPAFRKTTADLKEVKRKIQNYEVNAGKWFLSSQWGDISISEWNDWNIFVHVEVASSSSFSFVRSHVFCDMTLWHNRGKEGSTAFRANTKHDRLQESCRKHTGYWKKTTELAEDLRILINFCKQLSLKRSINTLLCILTAKQKFMGMTIPVSEHLTLSKFMKTFKIVPYTVALLQLIIALLFGKLLV